MRFIKLKWKIVTPDHNHGKNATWCLEEISAEIPDKDKKYSAPDFLGN